MLRAATLLPLALASAVIVAPGCGGARGRAKAALAREGTIEASWSGGRDESRGKAYEFVVVRKGGRLATYVIATPDDGDEESAPVGFIDPDRCVMVKHGTGRQIWPDGKGRWRFADMGPMEDIPTDCSEYSGTPAQPFVHSAKR